VEAVCLEDKGIEFGVEFVELAGGFVEAFVVKFGDAPQYPLPPYGSLALAHFSLHIRIFELVSRQRSQENRQC